jgi:hypothetical protein
MNRAVIESSIEKSVDFLCRTQLEWGEFPVYGRTMGGDSVYYFKTVFASTFVLHALSFVENTPRVREVKEKAKKFILSEQDTTPLWRYFGKDSALCPDLDDTACVLAALAKNDYPVDPELCDQFLKYRDPSTGLFKTWVEMPPNTENDIDSVVNANILFLYGLLGRSRRIPEVISYLLQEADVLHIQNSQVWYHSPLVFAYAVSRAFHDGHVSELVRARPMLLEHLVFSQQDTGCWCNPLETAFATTTLLNYSSEGDEVEKAIRYLIDAQDAHEGSWPADFFYVLAEEGSKQLTTAMCVEALIKYKLKRNGQ